MKSTMKADLRDHMNDGSRKETVPRDRMGHPIKSMWNDRTPRKVNGQLTGNGEGGVAGASDTGQVAGHAPVHSGVILLAAVRRPQEEQGTARQQDPVHFIVAHAADAGDQLPVVVPFDGRRRAPVGRALQRHRVVAGHRHVRWMLRYPRRFTHC